jgi:hypothetical protein
MGDILPEPVPQAPISELLTVVITTSPTPSAPTTDLISSVLQSFDTHCPGLLSCRIIVVFDTFDRIGPKNRLKKGTVTEEGARIFEEYKSNVKQLILRIHPSTSSSPPASIPLTTTHDKAEYGLHEQPIYHVPFTTTSTPDRTITFIEPTQRLGFGLGVRTALRTARTPYVWIHQHDWTLISPIPLPALLRVLSQSTPSVPVQYICFPSVRMLRYAVSDHVTHFPALRALTNRYKRTFTFPSSFSSSSDDEQVPLTPLFFWHDKPHLAAREHYLDRIFPSRLAIGRGEFIEDRVGQRARDQMKQGIWERWACWLYYPDDGRELVVRHLNGRIWRGQEEEERRREWRAGREGEEEEEEPERDGEVEEREDGGDE